MKYWYPLILLLLALPLKGRAQDLEYRMELGGGLGTCFYTGDANSSPFRHPSVMGGVIARRILNPRMVVKGDLAFGHVYGNSSGIFIPNDATSLTPEGGQLTKVHFKRNLLDLGAQFEFNFWGYGLSGGYKGHSPLTPYATAGLGFTLAMGGGANANLALNAPIGVGVKYKLKPRLNVGAEWTMRFTTTDKLDVSGEYPQLNQPYGIESIGFKNKDCYSFLMFFVTYDLSPKYRQCNN